MKTILDIYHSYILKELSTTEWCDIKNISNLIVEYCVPFTPNYHIVNLYNVKRTPTSIPLVIEEVENNITNDEVKDILALTDEESNKINNYTEGIHKILKKCKANVGDFIIDISSSDIIYISKHFTGLTNESMSYSNSIYQIIDNIELTQYDYEMSYDMNYNYKIATIETSYPTCSLLFHTDISFKRNEFTSYNEYEIVYKWITIEPFKDELMDNIRKITFCIRDNEDDEDTDHPHLYSEERKIKLLKTCIAIDNKNDIDLYINPEELRSTRDENLLNCNKSSMMELSKSRFEWIFTQATHILYCPFQYYTQDFKDIESNYPSRNPISQPTSHLVIAGFQINGRLVKTDKLFK
jgi:hypothetical protein